MLQSPDDVRLTPDQRRREIASILAQGDGGRLQNTRAR